VGGTCLLLSVSNVNGDFAIAEILEAGGLTIVLPSDSRLFACLEYSGSSGVSDL
jgi:hypothetical protein